MEDIVARIVDLGFNCVRLVFSLELWYTDPEIEERAVAANPGKKHIHTLEYH